MVARNGLTPSVPMLFQQGFRRLVMDTFFCGEKDFNKIVESFFDGSRDELLREVKDKKAADKKAADINRCFESNAETTMKEMSRFVGKIAYKLGNKFSSLWLPTWQVGDVFFEMTADELYLLDAIRGSSVVNVTGLDTELVDYVCVMCGHIERGGLWIVEQSGRAIVRVVSRAIVRVKRGLKYNTDSFDSMEQWDACTYKYDDDVWSMSERMFEEITADSVDVVIRRWGSDVRSDGANRVRKSRLLMKVRDVVVPLREVVSAMLVDDRCVVDEVRELLVDILEESSEKRVKERLSRWLRMRDYVL